MSWDEEDVHHEDLESAENDVLVLDWLVNTFGKVQEGSASTN